jgi:hypothetical protein
MEFRFGHVIHQEHVLSRGVYVSPGRIRCFASVPSMWACPLFYFVLGMSLPALCIPLSYILVVLKVVPGIYLLDHSLKHIYQLRMLFFNKYITYNIIVDVGVGVLADQLQKDVACGKVRPLFF